MTPVGLYYRLTHPDIEEEVLLTEAQYDALIGGDGDWPPDCAVDQITLVTLAAFVALIRVQEGEV